MHVSNVRAGTICPRKPHLTATPLSPKYVKKTQSTPYISYCHIYYIILKCTVYIIMSLTRSWSKDHTTFSLIVPFGGHRAVPPRLSFTEGLVLTVSAFGFCLSCRDPSHPRICLSHASHSQLGFIDQAQPGTTSMSHTHSRASHVVAQVFVRPPPQVDFSICLILLLASPFQKCSSLIKHCMSNCVSASTCGGLSQWLPSM